ncbi:MAG: HAMP domain-containing sensor histidine kinase [Clostridiales bacterium]|jgi:signal transduction histidine kinase|nr:HAMP domain-containing histidine kinase [Eubacteriales bacterium]MDH7565919.1 HAMP domain-containing sensor histidine kinase [Clostridiales bacterium]
MKIFINKEVKILFVMLAVVFLSFMILGQITVKLAADSYKQNMIFHDYGVAGHLARNGLDESQILRSFTSEKTKDDVESGRELLQTAGYNSGIQNSLLPAVERFYQKYAVILLILSIAFLVMVCAVFLFFILRQYKRIEKADSDIRDFMAGNFGIRLDDHQEGSLSKLFSSVNAMATSQAAHIEKEKQNREFLKDTISDISHQLKTPLAALKMYNEIIQNEKVGNDTVDSFTLKSERELARMESLIQNLLKLAKLDAGSIKLEKNAHNLKEFLEEAIKGFRTRAELEGKAILLHCDQHITMNFDEEWLMEAVSNIIKNALDHTEAKNQIEIRCDETPVLTQITIKDNGMGIHPEDIHHIFRRFYQSRFSKDKQGVGIGLTLSKAIVEKHGGSIMVESELGKGTAFYLTFPKLSNL